jgi:hypothetical protein
MPTPPFKRGPRRPRLERTINSAMVDLPRRILRRPPSGQPSRVTLKGGTTCMLRWAPRMLKLLPPTHSWAQLPRCSIARDAGSGPSCEWARPLLGCACFLHPKGAQIRVCPSPLHRAPRYPRPSQPRQPCRSLPSSPCTSFARATPGCLSKRGATASGPRRTSCWS